ncbi:MAG: hypothetical protein JRC77_03765, partial [Deltaproteobacteria bacterium]|nr:hypothetical protein [Deltaproteobacteria bacterium]
MGTVFQNRNLADPLTPDLLNLRTQMFEFTALPSILSQTNQDFSWVLIIDKDLPQQDKIRLKNSIKKKERAYLYEYDPEDKIDESCDWLKPYMSTEPNYLLTTNHDDDDLLPINFVSEMHNHLAAQHQATGLPPLKTLGCKQGLQWDLTSSREAPMGWVADWTRRERVLSCGASLLCRYPDYPINVTMVPHACTENCLDWSAPPRNPKAAIARAHFQKFAARNDDSLEGISTKETFHDLSREVGPVLMSNHVTNVQAARLFEVKANRTPVQGPESFPALPVDFDRYKEHAKVFEKGRRYYQRQVQTAFRIYGKPLMYKIRNRAR